MNNKNIFKLTSTYISVILGAGFISGKEIYFFFGQYNFFGLITLFLVSILFSIILYKQLSIIYSNDIKNYHDFSSYIMNKKISKIIENITLIFLFVIISTMISAFCQTIDESFSVPILFTQIFIFFITLYFLVKGVDFIIILNSFLTPIMIIGTIIIGAYISNFETMETFSYTYKNNNINYIVALSFALLYVSFNSLTSVPMISNVKNILDSKKTILIGTLLSGLILFILGFNILYPIIINSKIIQNSDIPILTLLKNKNFLVEYIYILILLCAIFSTLISTSVSFIHTIESKMNIKKDSLFVKILILFFALCFSTLGFANFVKFIYPVFGVLGLAQIYFILTKKII